MNILWAMPALVACLIIFPSPAHAYVDLCTGSLLTQVFISGIIWALLSVKAVFTRIKLGLARPVLKADET
jgi:hypothetical protein